MQSRPTVSVIIPTYRRAALVPRAIKSALDQTYRNIEVIVVDDGSPDDPGDVIAAIGDPRVRYIRHERNAGLPATRNTGIRAASGTYVAFLDDDDEWFPDKLEYQVPAFSRYSAVVCGYVTNGTDFSMPTHIEVSIDDLKRGNEWPPSGLMVRTSLMKEIWFDENLPHAEDWDLLIRLALRAPIGYVPRALVRIDDGNHPRMTNSAKNTSLEKLDVRMAVLRKHETLLGPYWMRYHTAKWLLSYLGNRDGKLRQLRLAWERSGVVAVAAVMTYKAKRRWRKIRRSRLWTGMRWNRPTITPLS